MLRTTKSSLFIYIKTVHTYQQQQKRITNILSHITVTRKRNESKYQYFTEIRKKTMSTLFNPAKASLKELYTIKYVTLYEVLREFTLCYIYSCKD